MCGYGGDIFAIVWTPDGEIARVQRLGTQRVRRDASTPCATAIGSDDDAGARPPLGHRARRRRGMVHAARTLRHADVRRPRADTRCATRATASRCRRAIQRNLRAIAADRDATTGRRSGARSTATARRCSGSPSSRGRSRRCATDGPGRLLPGADRRAIAETLQGYGALITADDIAAHTGDWVEPLLDDLPRRRGPRAPAELAGRRRARSAQHRRGAADSARRSRPTATTS